MRRMVRSGKRMRRILHTGSGSRRGLAVAGLLAAAATPVMFTAGSSAAPAPVAQGFTVTSSDLSHILRQIQIAERHVAQNDVPGWLSTHGICDALVGSAAHQISSPLVADGLRTVDGSCNNLVQGQEKFGASGQVFPRLTTPVFRDAEDVPPGFGPPGPPVATSYKQKSGLVFDSQPRLISNLIVDQTASNPAAVSVAGFPSRTQGNEGLFSCIATDEVQTLSGTPSGYFSLEFEGQRTASLPPDATALQIRTALVALNNIGPADVGVSGGALPGAITIKFVGALKAKNVAQLLVVPGTSPILGVNVTTTQQGAPAVLEVIAVGEVQTVSGTTSGDYALTFDGETTTTLASTATAADVETALNDLTNLDGVTVSGGPLSDGTPLTITFPDTLGDVPELQTANPDLSVATDTQGVAGVTPVPAQNEKQDIAGTPSATYSISFDGETTASLAPTAGAAAVESALKALGSIGDGDVAVTETVGVLTVEFQGDLAGTDVPELTIVPGTSAITDATAATTTQGNSGADACVPEHGTLFIPNVTTDVGLSPPFNSLFTIFGQFFDHGVDQTVKGGGTVFVPLADDDPLIAGPDHILVDDPTTQANEAADNLPPQQRFMVLTRGKNQPGPDGQLGTADDIQDANNTDTPFVDQSQTYTSHPAHQVFLRDYNLDAAGKPVATGKLLHSADGGMGTWALLKLQARTKLGLELRDVDATDVPMVAADLYGNFIPGPARGLPQYVTDTGLVEGDIASPVTPPANVKHIEIPFLTDIAHSADPSGGKPKDADLVAGKSLDTPVPAGSYDNELLDLHFIAGDGRVNENIALTAVHQIFHSEHDRLVDDITATLNKPENAALKAQFEAVNLAPSAGLDRTFTTGERLFQAARFVTEMEYQHLVFEEFARKVQPLINPFAGFAFTQTNIDPAVKAEFAHAVYRFGHSMLTEVIARRNAGSPANVNDNDIKLLDGFLNPAAYTDGGPAGTLNSQQAAGSIFMGLSDDTGNEIDEFVTDTLRNNLLGLPLDLPAINMTRARSEGIPPLNELRRQIYATTQDSQLKPYTDWTDFGMHLKHPESLINFVAAYGLHPNITGATTAAAKREAARKIVDPAPGELVADAADFMNHTGTWSSKETGLNNVDLWVGGLAERTNLFGGLLGSTFNYVFESQLTDLQNSDRLYYLGRTPGMNLRAQLEGNSFAELVMRNTDAHTLKADAFATADCKFELANLPASDAPFTGNSVADDPNSECDEHAVLIRMADGTIRYRTTNTVDPPGINGQSVYNGRDDKADKIFGGVDNDTFLGNGGNDIIEGSDGADVALGGEGDDIITDNAGDDVHKGGPGNDAIETGPGLDIIMGGDGKDFMNGGANINEIFGGEGDDFMILGQGEDAGQGDSGDDWMEGGDQPDLLQGDSGGLFFDDRNAPGHDVFVGQAGDDDYDAEGGDDIMVTGPGIEKNAGAAGYDWSTGFADPQPQNADLSLKILPPDIIAVDLRDRFNEVEALSGGPFDDQLRGEILAPSTLGGGGFLGCDVLDQSSLDRISGLGEIVPDLSTLSASVIPATDVTATAQTNACNITGNVWGDGDILIGGAGSDILEGRGANDILDGDRYLRVRLSVRTPGAQGVELGSTDLMENTAVTGNFGPETDGMTLQQAVFAGKVNPGNIHIVREIVSVPPGTDIDVAVFSDARENYEITTINGVTTVSHLAGTGADGIDTLRNVERLQFIDQVVTVGGAVTPTNAPTLGSPVITGTPQAGVALSAGNGDITDADGIASISFAWQADIGLGVFATVGAGPTFTPGNAQVGQALRVQATVVDSLGQSSVQTSAVTAPVAPAPGSPIQNVAATGAPIITDAVAGIALAGRPRVNEQIGADTAGIDDQNGIANVVFTYQWQHSSNGTDFTDIAGATGKGFVPTTDLLGDVLRVRVSFTDNAGFPESVVSAATQDVRPARGRGGRPAVIVLSGLSVPRTVSAATVATSGLRVSFTAPARTTLVRVMVFRVGSKRPLVKQFIKVKSGKVSTKLRTAAMKRALRLRGHYRIEFRPGTSRTKLGKTTVRMVTVRR